MAVQNFKVRNSIDIVGNSLNTSSTTFNLINSTATTGNIFGATTALNVGSTTGTLTLNNPTVVGSQTTVNLWNTTSTTVNAFGAATSVIVGANSDSGTTTIRSGTLVGTRTTQNIFDTTATTINAFGAGTSIDFGANSGTLTVNNPTVVGSQSTVNLWNTTSTTVNAFGAGTSITIGSTTGTTTIRNAITALSNALTVGSTATVTTSTTSPVVQGSTSNSGTLTLRSTSSATKSTAGILLDENIASTSNTTGTLVVTGGVGIGGNLNVGGDIVADGDIFIKAKDGTGGTITLGQGASDSVNIQADISSNLLPDTTTLDIGSSLKKWRNLYLSGTADLTTATVSGTSTLTTLSVTGNTTLGDSSTDTVTITGSPTITAPAQFSNTVSMSSTLSLTGLTPTIANATAGAVASIFNTSVPTINIGGAATSVNIGASTGTTTVNHDLDVTKDLTVTGALNVLGSIQLVNIPFWFDKTISLNETGGPYTDAGADGGGLILRGTTYHSILFSDTYDAWDSTESINLASGRVYRINGADVLSSTSLGAGVVNSALTSVGTLTSLTVSGASTLQSTLGVTGDFAVNTNKFNITASSGNTTIAGTLGVTGALTPSAGLSGIITFNNTTQQTATGQSYAADGSVRLLGGMGVAGNVAIAGDLQVFGSAVYAGGSTFAGVQTFANKIRSTSTADASSSTDTNSAFSTTGGVAIAKNIYVGATANVGYLTVNGTSQFTGGISASGGIVGDLTGNVTGQVSSISNHTTTNLTEGTNLYFTNERVDDRVAALISGGTGISSTYDDNGNLLTISADFTEYSTTNITEGTNLYYTQARFDTAFGNKTTTNLTEGTNLYYTDERVDDRVGSLVSGGTGITSTYDDANNLLGLSIDFTEFSTTNVVEGTNLYFTNSRARSSISVSGSLSYDSGTGVISYTTPSTTGITEGTNLYYTDERVDDRVGLLISGGTGITASYDDNNNLLGLSVDFTEFSTTNVTEGTNLYYTDERVDDRVDALITAGTGIQKTYDDTLNTYTLALDFTEFNTSNITENTNLYYTTTRANTDIDARVTKTFVENLAISYTSLSNLPTLFSGSYNDLTNTPTIPASGVDFDPVGTDNSTNVSLAGTYDYLTIVGQVITLNQIDATTDISGLSDVATTGSYNDLTNLPTLFSGSYNDLTNLPTLFSGSYNDLTNKPTAFTADKIASNTAPTTATDTGTAGEVRYDASYIYVCVDTDTWVRAALSTW